MFRGALLHCRRQTCQRVLRCFTLRCSPTANRCFPTLHAAVCTKQSGATKLHANRGTLGKGGEAFAGLQSGLVEKRRLVSHPRFRPSAFRSAAQHVSSFGRVARCDFAVLDSADYCCTNGYAAAGLSGNCGFVRRTARCTFCGEPPSAHRAVDHRGRGKTGNSAGSLRWASPSGQTSSRTGDRGKCNEVPAAPSEAAKLCLRERTNGEERKKCRVYLDFTTSGKTVAGLSAEHGVKVPAAASCTAKNTSRLDHTFNQADTVCPSRGSDFSLNKPVRTTLLLSNV